MNIVTNFNLSDLVWTFDTSTFSILAAKVRSIRICQGSDGVSVEYYCTYGTEETGGSGFYNENCCFSTKEELARAIGLGDLVKAAKKNLENGGGK